MAEQSVAAMDVRKACLRVVCLDARQVESTVGSMAEMKAVCLDNATVDARAAKLVVTMVVEWGTAMAALMVELLGD